MGAKGQNPLDLLRLMQRAGRPIVVGLPGQVKAAPLWSGLGFRLDRQRYVTPLDHVSEVLPCPPLTPVPRTRTWVKGIASVRGNLLTVVDLPGYFGKPPVRLDDKKRLLVLSRRGLNTAVLVDEVLGLRHFDEEHEKHELSSLEGTVSAHMRGAFLHDDVIWGIFDMHSLAESAGFMQVAA